MTKGKRIEKNVDIKHFKTIIDEYGIDKINCSNHTLFRLSEKQRSIYNSKRLKEIILNEEPIFVGLQYNKLYACFYAKDQRKAFRFILDVKIKEIVIVTFLIVSLNIVEKIKNEIQNT